MRKISDLRREYGNISQGELAKMINVTPASISQWEQNQTNIIGLNMMKLGKTLILPLMSY